MHGRRGRLGCGKWAGKKWKLGVDRRMSHLLKTRAEVAQKVVRAQRRGLLGSMPRSRAKPHRPASPHGGGIGWEAGARTEETSQDARTAEVSPRSEDAERLNRSQAFEQRRARG